jgi:antitoxin (DNA-binding transcriptional repressor) of toxin-antitoxin stability system
MFVMNSNVKGAVAEQAIVLAATKLRLPVWRPIGEHGRADLALEIGGQLMRVQVKWGRLNRSRDVVIVAVATSRCTPHGHVRSRYTEQEVDLFAVYCGDLDRCFLLPAQLLANRTVAYLRLSPSRNGQRACINLADDFTFDGAVAQLARATRWQRVGQGFESPQLHSIPANGAVTIGAEVCRGSLGRWLDRVAAGEDVVVTRRGKPMIRLTAVTRASDTPPGSGAQASDTPPGSGAQASDTPPGSAAPASVTPPGTVAGPSVDTPDIAPRFP